MQTGYQTVEGVSRVPIPNLAGNTRQGGKGCVLSRPPLIHSPAILDLCILSTMTLFFLGFLTLNWLYTLSLCSSQNSISSCIVRCLGDCNHGDNRTRRLLLSVIWMIKISFDPTNNPGSYRQLCPLRRPSPRVGPDQATRPSEPCRDLYGAYWRICTKEHNLICCRCSARMFITHSARAGFSSLIITPRHCILNRIMMSFADKFRPRAVLLITGRRTLYSQEASEPST